MAKISAYIPEPTQNYDVSNQRQILEALSTLKDQLNFSFQKELRDEIETFSFFLIGTGIKNTTKGFTNALLNGGQLNVTLSSVTVWR